MDQVLNTAPRIGMGCWAIGGPFWNGEIPVGYSGTNDVDSKEAIQAAWSAGVRVFDTSAVYGAGHSETLLGEALAGKSDAIIVSKLGHSFDAQSKQMTGPKFDPAYVRESVDQSRRRLQRDEIDVMLLHLNDLPVEDAFAVFDTLEEIRSRRQITAYGWSTDFPDRLCAFAERAGFTAVQHSMNVFVEAAELNVAAQARDITQLIRSPLAMGVLTGKFSDGHRVPEDDIRCNDADWQGYFANGSISPESAKQLDAVRSLLTVGGRTLAQGALCWLLAKSPSALPLPGAKNARQAEENAGALEFGPIPADVMAEIENVLNRSPEDAPRAR